MRLDEWTLSCRGSNNNDRWASVERANKQLDAEMSKLDECVEIMEPKT